MEIKWTPKAEESFEEIVDYLATHWTDREVENFVEQTDNVIDNISQNPFMYAASQQRKNTRRALIGSLTSLFYRVKEGKKLIELLLFWDNRKNPKKMKID